jgi:hypothetical protein
MRMAHAVGQGQVEMTSTGKHINPTATWPGRDVNTVERLGQRWMS